VGEKGREVMPKESLVTLAARELALRRAEVLTPEQRSESARKAGLVGGKARKKALTKQQRSEIARKAAAARWGK
jgi:hypothetical protein